MRRRRSSRTLALEVLYEHEITGAPPNQILERHRERSSFAFAEDLVAGVSKHREEIDSLISAYSTDWTIERMPVVDRSILRMGIFEILYEDDVPDAVAIDEAIELAKEFSTDDSGRFVNAILARVAENRPNGGKKISRPR